MKIRSGFVSNSSSSSFILEIFEVGEPCPHCGRKDPDLIDLIEQNSNTCDDTYIVHYEKDDIIGQAEGMMTQLQSQIMDLQRDDPKRELSRYPSSFRDEDCVERVEDRLKNLLGELEEWSTLRDKVEPAKGRVIECRVSYHSEIQSLIGSMAAAGSLNILEQEND